TSACWQSWQHPRNSCICPMPLLGHWPNNAEKSFSHSGFVWRFHVSFIRTGFREIALKVKRQKTRIALRHDRRVLQRSEINLGREGTAQAANFPELRNEIVALKKLEQEHKEVALRIARIDEGIKRIEEERQQIAREQAHAIAKLEGEKKPLLQHRNQAKTTAE